MTSWRELADSAASCTRCDLYKRATGTVFGEGPVDSALVLVGETPGDQEDKHGRPFVGPAGRVLDRALADSGIPRADVYLTNAVKHFKWTARGKRRIHQRPNSTEIKACEFWLEAELGVVRPGLVVLLGAVAGEAMFGSRFRVGEHKGKVEDASLGSWSPPSTRRPCCAAWTRRAATAPTRAWSRTWSRRARRLRSRIAEPGL